MTNAAVRAYKKKVMDQAEAEGADYGRLYALPWAECLTSTVLVLKEGLLLDQTPC